jgi:hypothetical protein
VIALDNLSGIPVWLSDAICRLSTGGGFATHTLYEGDQETIFAACRPVVANGIDELASRHDLLDRAIILNLLPIPEEERVGEATLWTEFQEARARILGALLDAVAAGLRNLPHVELYRLPRMADFAKWVVACEEALPWPAGGFLEAYSGNRTEAVELALEADAVAVAVKELLETREVWEGTATELLAALEQHASDQVRRTHAWPASARALGNRLRRAANILRQAGVEVEFYREPGGSEGRRKRLIRLSKRTSVPVVPTVPEKPETVATQGIAGRDVSRDVRDVCVPALGETSLPETVAGQRLRKSRDVRDAKSDLYSSGEGVEVLEV